ncbi:MAG: ABC transporter permease [Clostridium sp.]
MKGISKEKFVISIFFVVAFSMTILSFSLGVSLINSYRDKLLRYDVNKNKIITIENIDKYTTKDLKQSLKNCDLTVTIKQFQMEEDSKNSYNISTILQKGNFNTQADLRDGEYLTLEEFKESKEYIGVFSSSIEENTKRLLNGKEIRRIGQTFETMREIYVPNEIFYEVTGTDNIALGYTIQISGDERELDLGIKSIIEDIKKINKDGNIIVENNFIDNRNKEGKLLIYTSFLIIFLTIINSTSISKLWVENKKKELVLRMTCGAKERDIFKHFYKEMIILSLISTVIAVGSQGILSILTKGLIYNLDIRLSINNFIMSIILSVVVAIIVALPSLRYISKIELSEMLREE